MGDLLLLAITCVWRLHWSARRGSWSRVIRWGVDFIPMNVTHMSPSRTASLVIIVPTRSPFIEISKSQKSERDTGSGLLRPH
eukprot:scaffold17184_cov76-Phaeocystis_antarctica.AAC.1